MFVGVGYNNVTEQLPTVCHAGASKYATPAGEACAGRAWQASRKGEVPPLHCIVLPSVCVPLKSCLDCFLKSNSPATDLQRSSLSTANINAHSVSVSGTLARLAVEMTSPNDIGA